jgi:hypothetical protein
MGGANSDEVLMGEVSRTAGTSDRMADEGLAAAGAGATSNHVVVAASMAVVVGSMAVVVGSTVVEAGSTAVVDHTVAVADMVVEGTAKTLRSKR